MYSNSITIRPYQVEDEQQVIELWHRCNLIVHWNDPKQDIDLKLQFQPDLFLVGKVDDIIIATIMAGYEGHRGWINYLAVSPVIAFYESLGFTQDNVISLGKRL